MWTLLLASLGLRICASWSSYFKACGDFEFKQWRVSSLGLAAVEFQDLAHHSFGFMGLD